MFSRRHKNKELSQYLKNTLGLRIKNISLYEQAFIHRSYHQAGNTGHKIDNERLEYLGDAVLSTISANFLYKKYPNAQEGFLTNMRSKLVSREHLNKLGVKLGMDKFVIADEHIDHLSQSIYGNAFEAFVGAMFLDLGFDKTQKIVIYRFIDMYVDLDALEKEDHNYKGKLMQYAQKYKQTIEYKTVKEDANSYGRKEYVVYLFLNEKFIAEGCDFNIKGAQQQAAMMACNQLNI